MLENGVISSWSSPAVLVKRKGQKYRFCVEYQKLNAVTKKVVYPLQVIDDLLSYLSGAKYFSTLGLDLYRGYWQMGVEEDSKEKTAFSVRKDCINLKFYRLVCAMHPVVYKNWLTWYSKISNERRY